MGGLRRLLPLTYWCFLAGALSLVGIPPFAGFFSKDSILAATLAARNLRRDPLGVRHRGTFLTGVYTFRMLFLVFWGEPSAFARSTTTRIRQGRRRRDVLAGALLDGSLDLRRLDPVRAVWTPISNFLEPSAPPLVDASGTQELVSSIFAVGFGLVGIGVAWAIYAARRVAVPRVAAAAASARAQVLVRRALRRGLLQAGRVDCARLEPLDRAAADPRFRNRGRASRRSRRAARRPPPDRLVRAYALALAGGLAVLVVVFISVR